MEVPNFRRGYGVFVDVLVFVGGPGFFSGIPEGSRRYSGLCGGTGGFSKGPAASRVYPGFVELLGALWGYRRLEGGIHSFNSVPGFRGGTWGFVYRKLRETVQSVFATI